MLSAANEPIVRATLPVVGQHLETITGVFYNTMLTEQPELLDAFSRSAQATGAQRQALAGAVAAFAASLTGAPDADTLPIEVMIGRIAHRHASLGIRPEQYTLVGKYLLQAVATVLGAAVTPQIAAAWDEVYWLFAVRLIGRESRLHAGADVTTEQPWRQFVLAHRHDDAADTVSFVLTPADDRPAPAFTPGQYVTAAVDLPGIGRQLRQYSLSQAPAAGALRITVRRARGRAGAPDGLVSTHLHDHVHEGNQLTLSAPYGDLTLRPGTNPLVLISAGVGITPIAAILDHTARTQPTRDVVAVHAEHDPTRHPLRADIISSGTRLRSFRHLVWYSQPPSESLVLDGVEVHTGRVQPDAIPLHPDSAAYLCGPVPFMQSVRTALRQRGLPSEQIRYEVFGPDQWTPTRAA
jgi:nitric oxide dioxygenase